MKKTILLLAVLAFITFNNQAQSVTDYDGNVYDTVKIGTQVWLKENLKTTHYRNGDPIPKVIVDTIWANLTTGAYSDVFNKPTLSNTYGRLYNWFVVNDSRKICPINWHIPTNTEWTLLITYLGGESVAGGKLKETDTLHWKAPNTGATNESGFTALPSGARGSDGSFGIDTFLGKFCSWWTSTGDTTEPTHSYALDWFLSNTTRNIVWASQTKQNGFSVRCLKNTKTQIDEHDYNGRIDLFPNPATDKIYVICSTIQNLKMQVYNTVGQCVLQRELNAQTNEIDISSLTKGIYILKLTSPNGTFEKKLIKE